MPTFERFAVDAHADEIRQAPESFQSFELLRS
jgi:hypothetical protein